MIERYVLTGTPGSGKTAVLRDLERRGFWVVEEAATDVIGIEQALGVARPWEVPEFVESVVRLQKTRQINNDRLGSGVRFHDRSPICTLALARYLGTAIPRFLQEEVARVIEHQVYQRTVFFVENLGSCLPTAARTLTLEEALAFEKIHWEAYAELGFDLRAIPPGPLRERTDRILTFV